MKERASDSLERLAIADALFNFRIHLLHLLYQAGLTVEEGVRTEEGLTNHQTPGGYSSHVRG